MFYIGFMSETADTLSATRSKPSTPTPPMKINAELVLDTRNAQAWSQEELAIAAGLNLRTIQRVESEGVASLQTKKALAAAFGMEAGDLDYHEKPMITKYEYKVLRCDMQWKGLESGKLVSDFTDIEEAYNQLGAEGWELVRDTSITTTMGLTRAVMATFRRPIH